MPAAKRFWNNSSVLTDLARLLQSHIDEWIESESESLGVTLDRWRSWGSPWGTWRLSYTLDTCRWPLDVLAHHIVIRLSCTLAHPHWHPVLMIVTHGVLLSIASVLPVSHTWIIVISLPSSLTTLRPLRSRLSDVVLSGLCLLSSHPLVLLFSCSLFSSFLLDPPSVLYPNSPTHALSRVFIHHITITHKLPYIFQNNHTTLNFWHSFNTISAVCVASPSRN